MINVFSAVEGDDISYDDACGQLKDLYLSKSADVPRILRLLRLTFSERRKYINNLANTEVSKMTEAFPHLKQIKYVSMCSIYIYFTLSKWVFSGQHNKDAILLRIQW